MWLISGKTMNTFKRFMDDLSVGTSDFGVEFSLSKVLPMRAADLFPWMSPDDSIMQVPGDDDDDDQQQQPSQDVLLGMQRSISAPGLLHITHNVGMIFQPAALSLTRLSMVSPRSPDVYSKSTRSRGS
eukprot:7457585-Pyramimonas_sp.AAC.1